MMVSDTIKNLTLQHRSAGEIAAAAIKEGIVTLYRDGLNKFREGITSFEELLRVLNLCTKIWLTLNRCCVIIHIN